MGSCRAVAAGDLRPASRRRCAGSTVNRPPVRVWTTSSVLPPWAAAMPLASNVSGSSSMAKSPVIGIVVAVVGLAVEPVELLALRVGEERAAPGDRHVVDERRRRR